MQSSSYGQLRMIFRLCSAIALTAAVLFPAGSRDAIGQLRQAGESATDRRPESIDARQRARPADVAPMLGRLEFSTSAAPDAHDEFVTGLLALHSFWYDRSRDHFSRARQLDPRFGMAYWGEAMTYDDALSTVPGDEGEVLGEAVVARMDRLDAAGRLDWTPRERAYRDAVRLRFAPETGYLARRENYAAAMDRIVAEYPQDDEASVLASLALMALPVFDRRQASHVVAVASRLEEVYQRNTAHPGVLHYLIHVYDTPTFALMGLRQARLYDDIAPASSHALHMPSHIYRHLGMWTEVAESNRAAYDASVRWQQRTGQPLHTRDFHALDWLLDATLRLERMAEARQIISDLDRIEEAIADRGEAWGAFREVALSMRTLYDAALDGSSELPYNGH